MERSDHIPNRFEGARVLITRGTYRGCEALCLGQVSQREWAISPDGTDEIINLEFEKDFGLLVDLSHDPAKN